jgi:hypothetical protein
MFQILSVTSLSTVSRHWLKYHEVTFPNLHPANGENMEKLGSSAPHVKVRK